MDLIKMLRVCETLLTHADNVEPMTGWQPDAQGFNYNRKQGIYYKGGERVESDKRLFFADEINTHSLNFVGGAEGSIL